MRSACWPHECASSHRTSSNWASELPRPRVTCLTSSDTTRRRQRNRRPSDGQRRWGGDRITARSVAPKERGGFPASYRCASISDVHRGVLSGRDTCDCDLGSIQPLRAPPDVRGVIRPSVRGRHKLRRERHAGAGSTDPSLPGVLSCTCRDADWVGGDGLAPDAWRSQPGMSSGRADEGTRTGVDPPRTGAALW